MNGVLLAAILAGSYLVGAVPVSNIVSHLVKGIDLREVGTQTVSPSNLYRVAGWWPTVLAGIFEVGKGIPGPALAKALPGLALTGTGHLYAAAACGALAVTGHNWSPFLKGAGGRGLSTATGALLVVAWPGAALLCAGLAVGGITRKIYPAMSVALFALLPVLALAGGPAEAVAGAIVVAPVGVKTGIVIRRRRADKKRAASQ